MSESYGMMAREHLDSITEEIGARYTGSTEEEEAGDYLIHQFEQYGYTPVIQSFSFTDDDENILTSRNIIAEKKGTTSDRLIIGAHYDSTGDGDGADDNGSGIAVLLELAERLQAVNTSYSIIFVGFGAEENYLDGSEYFVRHLSKNDRNSLLGFINLDGLIAGNTLYLYVDRDSPMYSMIENVPGVSDFTVISTDNLEEEDGSLCYCGDFSSFQEAGIPIVFIEATDYSKGDMDGWTQVDPVYGEDGIIRHTRYDTIRYIESSFPGRIDSRLSAVSEFIMNVLEKK